MWKTYRFLSKNDLDMGYVPHLWVYTRAPKIPGSWFINPIKYRYITYKNQIEMGVITNQLRFHKSALNPIEKPTFSYGSLRVWGTTTNPGAISRRIRSGRIVCGSLWSTRRRLFGGSVTGLVWTGEGIRNTWQGWIFDNIYIYIDR